MGGSDQDGASWHDNGCMNSHHPRRWSLLLPLVISLLSSCSMATPGTHHTSPHSSLFSSSPSSPLPASIPHAAQAIAAVDNVTITEESCSGQDCTTDVYSISGTDIALHVTTSQGDGTYDLLILRNGTFLRSSADELSLFLPHISHIAAAAHANTWIRLAPEEAPFLTLPSILGHDLELSGTIETGKVADGKPLPAGETAYTGSCTNTWKYIARSCTIIVTSHSLPIEILPNGITSNGNFFSPILLTHWGTTAIPAAPSSPVPSQELQSA